MSIRGNGEEGQPQASQAQAEVVLCDEALFTAFRTDGRDKFVEASVCIGRTICDLQAVVLELC